MGHEPGFKGGDLAEMEETAGDAAFERLPGANERSGHRPKRCFFDRWPCASSHWSELRTRMLSGGTPGACRATRPRWKEGGFGRGVGRRAMRRVRAAEAGRCSRVMIGVLGAACARIAAVGGACAAAAWRRCRRRAASPRGCPRWRARCLRCTG
eukprot:4467173-Pleurochrysis_carterae.AAC.1